jgi:hypothetical protein
MANQVLYGWHNIRDLAAMRVVGDNIPVINDAINMSVAEHNRQLDALFSLFVTPTTDYKRRYWQASNTRLQPLDNNGRALPIKPSGYYDVAWPIQAAGSAWGADYVTQIKMTGAEAERATAMMLEADFRWMRDHILSALYAMATWPFEDPLYGTLTINPLALASDGVTYPLVAGADTGATDTHNLGQANAIGAGADNPYPVIYAELVEHPENSGDVVAFIPSGLKATTDALATFHPIADPNISEGANADRLVGTLGVPVPGRLIGYEDSGVWVVEWASLPANYIIATMTGGPRAIAMRQDPEPELQGFKQVARRDDHPFYESQWLRRAGFGAYNRVGAVVMRISNATYAVPTGYTPPMW